MSESPSAVTSQGDWLARAFAAQARRWADRNAGGMDELAPAVAWVERAAYATSAATSAGHVCTLLDAIAQEEGIADPVTTDRLREVLLASGVVVEAGDRGPAPLVLDRDGRLYLRRYFDYERRLAARLVAAQGERRQVGPAAGALLRSLFAGASPAQLALPFGEAADSPTEIRPPRRAEPARPARSAEPDWQQLAVALALTGSLAIISGGPGTGKTATVVRLLACLLADAPQTRIALAAPTGKAAARMLEAIRERAAELPPLLRALLPVESFTVHRLLGVDGAGLFRHHPGNPLPFDVLVVDEASMLDLSLATHLLEAVEPQARIVLLGDKDQLAAVEAGAVFSELGTDPALGAARIAQLAEVSGVEPAKIRPPAVAGTAATRGAAGDALRDSVIWLDRNFRFGAGSAIGQLAADINAGDAAAALARLRGADPRELGWLDDDGTTLASASLQRIVDGYADYLDAVGAGSGDIAAVTAAFGRFRVLCAVRDGARGVRAINELMGRRVRAKMGDRLETGGGTPWYPGRPVLVQRNDYALKLFNGDVGLVLPDAGAGGALRAFFPGQDGAFRAVAPVRLPPHDTAFAITVHQSQGSEFERLLLLLPAQTSRATTRELLYTAITRARDGLDLIASAAVLEHAIATRTERRGGLAARLREAVAGK
jgi:exodeoxyribonuclease V alpha subunit